MAEGFHPVILSGGSGTRLWPASREHFPKQFLAFGGDATLLQETMARLRALERARPPLVIANADHRFLVADQVGAPIRTPSGGASAPEIVLEPVARGTAAAVAVAALRVQAREPEVILGVFPADHRIRDQDAFGDAVQAAMEAAAAGHLVTLGIKPTRAETGYGYVQPGASLGLKDGDGFRAASFVEKPDHEKAEVLLRDGRFFWNAGIFAFRADVILAELARHAPETLDACRRALAGATEDLGFLRLDASAFAEAPSASLDKAVMERTTKAAVIPCEIGWSDLGSWDELWEAGERDADGNVAEGHAELLDCRGTYVRGEAGLTAVLGLEDAVVVNTGDAVLVTTRGRSQEVRRVVEALRRSGRAEANLPRRVYRPWGDYQSVHRGQRFQVKEIVVKPGGKLSLQKHFHRSEHWIVVGGVALVTRDDEQVLLHEFDSIVIPVGAVHRLENPGKIDLHLIEVQSGPYLEEDDIVRLEDAYGRDTR